MTQEEKETFLILRGWQKNTWKLMNVPFSITENDGQPKVTTGEWVESQNDLWEKDSTVFKTMDEAMAIEGLND